MYTLFSEQEKKQLKMRITHMEKELSACKAELLKTKAELQETNAENEKYKNLINARDGIKEDIEQLTKIHEENNRNGIIMSKVLKRSQKTMRKFNKKEQDEVR